MMRKARRLIPLVGFMRLHRNTGAYYLVRIKPMITRLLKIV